MSRSQPPAWRSALAVFRLRSLMVSLAIVALVLTLIVQSQRAAERERQLRIELIQTNSKSRSDEWKRHFLGDLGIVILKDATQVELLQVGTSKAGQGDSRIPTGKVLGKDFANRIARILLDNHNYIYLDDQDMPDPQIGFRLTRGKDSIDLLFSLEGSGPGRPHQDVWVFVQSEYEIIDKFHESFHCFRDSDLEKLVNEARGK